MHHYRAVHSHFSNSSERHGRLPVFRLRKHDIRTGLAALQVGLQAVWCKLSTDHWRCMPNRQAEMQMLHAANIPAARWFPVLWKALSNTNSKTWDLAMYVPHKIRSSVQPPAAADRKLEWCTASDKQHWMPWYTIETPTVHQQNPLPYKDGCNPIAVLLHAA